MSLFFSVEETILLSLPRLLVFVPISALITSPGLVAAGLAVLPPLRRRILLLGGFFPLINCHDLLTLPLLLPRLILTFGTSLIIPIVLLLSCLVLLFQPFPKVVV